MDYKYDANCKWAGAESTADFTCTFVSEGPALETDAGTTTTTVKASEMATIGIFVEATVVNPTSTPAPSPSSTPGSSTPQSQSSNFAAAGPLPTGAMAFVGGAAGLYAALAL
jgi:hypothetical protein